MNAELARAAILAAAEWIELHPDLYDDTATVIPGDVAESASAKGWIGYFAGLAPDAGSTVSVEFGVLGYSEANGFHGDMEAICRQMGWRGWLFGWRSSAKVAARCLRRLAERYDEKNDGDVFADWVTPMEAGEARELTVFVDRCWGIEPGEWHTMEWTVDLNNPPPEMIEHPDTRPIAPWNAAKLDKLPEDWVPHYGGGPAVKP